MLSGGAFSFAAALLAAGLLALSPGGVHSALAAPPLPRGDVPPPAAAKPAGKSPGKAAAGKPAPKASPSKLSDRQSLERQLQASERPLSAAELQPFGRRGDR